MYREICRSSYGEIGGSHLRVKYKGSVLPLILLQKLTCKHLIAIDIDPPRES